MLKTTRFDAASYLETPKARAEYLTAAFETGDADFVRDALGVVARAEGMARVAKRAKRSRESLYRSLSKKGNPEFATIMSLLPALRLKLAALPVHSVPSRRRVAARRKPVQRNRNAVRSVL
jgi:probable addiction module antidote protein